MIKAGFDVVMLTTVHSATDDRIFRREAKTLAEAGLSVCVLGKHPTSESLDGVWIEALPKPANRIERFILGWTILKRAQKIGGKLFVFHDPELFWVALLLRLLGKKVIYDCHENLPMQLLGKYWIPRLARWPLIPAVWLTEWLSSRLLTGIIVVTETLQKRFPRKRTILVRNFPPRRELEALAQGPPVPLRPRVVIYAGGLTRIRGIRELVEAFRGPDLSDSELWLIGVFGPQQFELEILRSLPQNVKWLGWKDFREVLRLYQLSKIGVILYHPGGNHRNCLPAKLFQCLGAGLPVIASNFPEWASIVDGCGLQVNPFDVSEIRSAIQNLLSDDSTIAEMSRVGRDRVLKSYCWESEGKKLVEFCSRFISRTAA